MGGFRKGRPDFHLQYDPTDIRKLAAEYMETSADQDRAMEDAGRRIAGGDLTRSNLEAIYRWKSARRIRLLGDNTDAEIEQALKAAVGAGDVKVAVCSLTSLAGVGVKMASAILTAIDPECYTVLDIRALEALGTGDGEDVDLYVVYLEACRTMAERFGVTLRDFDRANWQWSKRQSRLAASAKRRLR